MSPLRSTVLGVIFGCVLYVSYLSRYKPAEVNSFRNFVRKEAEQYNLHLPAPNPEILPSSFESSVSFPERVSDLKIELPGVKKISFDPEEPQQIHQPLKPPKHIVHAPKVAFPEPKAARAAEDPQTSRCNDLKATYSVVPGSSWGTLTVELQGEWTKLRCDDHLRTSSSSSTTKVLDQLEAMHAPVPDEKNKKLRQKRNKQPKHKGEEAGLLSISGDSQEWCQDTMERYDVKPMKNWGTAPVNMQDAWLQRGCDLVFTRGRMSKRPLAKCSDPPTKTTAGDKLPLIAIMAATTTRRVKDPSTKNMALFTFMLPSLIRSLDCGYRYEYVLGYDKGDAFYDSEEGMAEVRRWWKSNVEDPLSGNGIKIILRLVRVNNTLMKPGPVFNEMARSAYQGGADYFYRVNDDTELMVNWPHSFVTALLSLPRPYGALGPVCHQGNQKILTHDFVSRLHMEIFEMNYYPPELTDWWMDDWISFVYGKSRTFKAAHIPVIHHTGAHGQRYEVNSEHEALLGPLIASGRQRIRTWMLKNSVPEDQLVLFDKDEYRAGFSHSDIPSSPQGSSQ